MVVDSYCVLTPNSFHYSNMSHLQHPSLLLGVCYQACFLVMPLSMPQDPSTASAQCHHPHTCGTMRSTMCHVTTISSAVRGLSITVQSISVAVLFHLSWDLNAQQNAMAVQVKQLRLQLAQVSWGVRAGS